ncbi:MAG: hypothetical protein QOK15_2671 [Nocardioidaceae bacterium]|nr:hypothetical protein [Nocardioidaceae bacterium]
MTSKSDFAEEEWASLVQAPFLVGMVISLADPGGPIEATKETMGTVKSATQPTTREQLLTDVALDVQQMVQAHTHPLKGYRPGATGDPRDEVLERLRAVRQLVLAKATPEEAAAFGSWLVEVGQTAAEAAKEGGFMGIGATRVSDREQAMLDRVREIVTA